MRNFRIGNVGLVCGVEQQKRLVFAGVIHPARKLLLRCDGTRWIVWKTKIDEIEMLVWRLWHEMIFRGAGQIMNALVAAILPHLACVARHHVCVYVRRIHRIRHRDLILAAENIENVAAIAF